MAGVRIQFVLDPEYPDEAVVLEWLDGLPKSRTGRLRVKKHIVPVLAAQARSKKGPSKIRRRTPQKDRNTGNGQIEKTERKAPAKATNGKEKPPPTDFPKIENLRF